MHQPQTEADIMKARLQSPDGAEAQHPARHGGALRLALGLAGAATLGTLAYAFAIRPWHLRWGATEEEAASTLPGDELLRRSRMQTTRAITIEASAAAIWPWLVQMGQGRGGLYSYDWLENLVGCDIHSADTIVPEFQNLSVGDTFRLGPEGYPFFTVASITPERELVLAANPGGHDGAAPAETSVSDELFPGATWAFVLRPIGENRTRLLIRLREDWEDGVGMALFNRAILEPAHFVMERKMIHGIKERAEQAAARE